MPESTSEPTPERTPGTFALPPDDGSLAAYRARALVANFLIILDEAEKGENWRTDVYRIENPETIGKRIIVPDEMFFLIDPNDPRVYAYGFDFTGFDEAFFVVEWKYFGIDKGGDDVAFFIPMSYVYFEFLGVSGKKFILEDKPYWVRFEESGNLLFEEIIPAQHQIYNYDNFTDEAHDMINAAFNASDATTSEHPPIRTWHFDGENL